MISSPRSSLPLALVAACLFGGLVLAFAGPADAAPRSLRIGIGDQKSLMFSDPHYRELGVRDARIVVPWDVRTIEWQMRETDVWMRAARAAGSRVLVTFSHSRAEGRRRVLPTPGRFKREFVHFRKRYPWARTFAVWNEPNHCGEPTCKRPRLVAAYYRKLHRACRTCTILPAELLDVPNMVRWARSLRRELGFEPKVWGLHNYVDANRMSTARTRTLLRSVRGHVWLTETGGLVARRNRGVHSVGFTEGSEHAARVTRFVLGRLAHVSRRITRIYLYHWDTVGPHDSWDSALIGPAGPRPAYGVLHRLLAGQRARAARAAARASRTAARHSGKPGPARRS